MPATGRTLKEARKYYNVKQLQVGKALGLDRSAISLMENKAAIDPKYIPALDKLFKSNAWRTGRLGDPKAGGFVKKHDFEKLASDVVRLQEVAMSFKRIMDNYVNGKKKKPKAKDLGISKGDMN